jgi:hypothetical protein
MRWRVSAAVLLLGGGLLSACASKPEYDVSENAQRPSHNAPQGNAQGNAQQQMRASNDPNNSWGDAVTAPLEDLNLKREQIPEILQDAVAKPYDLTGLDKCDAIAREVRKLDALLGKDFDEPPPPKDQSSLADKSGKVANDAAVGAVRGASRSIIPFRGLVRQMTGADAHAKEVDTAIQAGKVRRAYLKGVGMNKNCAPPAAPSWFKPRVYVDTYVPSDNGGGNTKKPNNSRRR